MATVTETEQKVAERVAREVFGLLDVTVTKHTPENWSDIWFHLTWTYEEVVTEPFHPNMLISVANGYIADLHEGDWLVNVAGGGFRNQTKNHYIGRITQKMIDALSE